MMGVVRIGEWILEVNNDKTKELNNGFRAELSKEYEMFLKVCASLTNDEYLFFKELELNPQSVRDFKHYKVLGNSVYTGNYYIYGKYLKTPVQDVITAQELYDRNFEYDFHDISVKIGRFTFKFQYLGHLIHQIPYDLPQNCICISFELWDTADGYVC